MKILLEDVEVWTLQAVNRTPRLHRITIPGVDKRAMQNLVDGGLIKIKTVREPAYTNGPLMFLQYWTITSLGKEVLKAHLPISSKPFDGPVTIAWQGYRLT